MYQDGRKQTSLLPGMRLQGHIQFYRVHFAVANAVTAAARDACTCADCGAEFRSERGMRMHAARYCKNRAAARGML